MIRSIFPVQGISETIWLKPSRFFVLVALMPSSVYTETNIHSALDWMYSV